jgi:hypothetical protein
MLNLKSVITIIQVPRADFPTRTKSYTMTFVKDVEIVTSWQNLTDTAKVKFPKNVHFTDENGSRVTWEGKGVTGESLTPPLMLRGDRITITLGYDYDTTTGRAVVMNQEFEGYITKITNRIPLEIECEDALFLMKQVQTPNKMYTSANYSVASMLSEMLTVALTDPNVTSYIKAELQRLNILVVSGTPSSDIINVNVGNFMTANDTISTVDADLKKDFRIYPYFRRTTKGMEFRCSGIVYFPQDNVNDWFVFQRNIISDALEYRRADDMQLGATVYSINKIDSQVANKSGKIKTQQKRLETFVGQQGGEIRTLYFWDVKDIKTLQSLATKELAKFHYEGFTGSFTTFGLPSKKHGDTATLYDKVLPERNGTYFIKAVTKNFGTGGFRQKIDTHFKTYNADGTAIFSPETINAGL